MTNVQLCMHPAGCPKLCWRVHPIDAAHRPPRLYHPLPVANTPPPFPISPHTHLLGTRCQQCTQVLPCVFNGLLTQLAKVGGQEAINSEIGILKRQQRTSAIA